MPPAREHSSGLPPVVHTWRFTVLIAIVPHLTVSAALRSDAGGLSRRSEIHGHLHRLADRLAAAADGLIAGDIAAANRLLASATRDLALVLELDHRVAVLEAGTPSCGAVVAAVDRVGARLAAAERDRRWGEVADLLSRELVPVLRAGAA